MKILIALLIALVICANVAAQTTEFTYQGRLVDGSLPANANYDFTFRLFDVDAGGTSLAGQIVSSVSVSNGIFTVLLDFGSNFDGGPRWIEIAVRPAGPGSYTTLSPRQPISSTPYSVRSLNSANADNATTATNSLQLGGVDANQFVVTNDPRMADARDPLPNSGNYVQNTASQQAASNFNISGNGTAGGTLTGNAVNSSTQYNIAGSRVLFTSTFSSNIFAGNGAGASNGLGSGNSFFGQGAGQSNVSTGNNSFFGRNAGQANTAASNSFFGESSGFGTSTGGSNSFFGQASGRNNATGSDNAFFGYRAGFNNTANGNSFFGSEAGDSVTTGQWNSFFGRSSGAAVTTGFQNSFFGFNAGLVNTANGNSMFGAFAGDANTTGTRNSFFGNGAGTTNISGDDNSFFGHNTGASNTTGLRNSHFGSDAGSANTNGSDNSFFGYDAGRLTNAAGSFINGVGNSFFGANAGEQNLTGSNNVFIGRYAGNTNTAGRLNTIVGWGADVGSGGLEYATAIGAGAVVTTNQTVILGRQADNVEIPGSLFVDGQVEMGTVTIDFLALPEVVATYGIGPLCILGTGTVVTCLGGVGPSGGNSTSANDRQMAQQRTQIAEQEKQLRQLQQQVEMLKKLVCFSQAESEFCKQ